MREICSKAETLLQTTNTVYSSTKTRHAVSLPKSSREERKRRRVEKQLDRSLWSNTTPASPLRKSLERYPCINQPITGQNMAFLKSQAVSPSVRHPSSQTAVPILHCPTPRTSELDADVLFKQIGLPNVIGNFPSLKQI